MQIFKIMYPNYKVVLDLRKAKKSGLYPVKVRVTLNRVQKYFSLGFDLSTSDFDRIQKSSVRKELKVFKNKITHWENKTKDIIHQMDPFSFDEFKSKLYEKNEIKVADVYTLFDRRINKLNEEGKVSTGRTYQDARNSLKKFKSRLKLADVTPGFLSKYESHMIAKGKSMTTISIYVRHLRTIFNLAIDAGFIDRKQYPFGKNRYQLKAPRNIKKALTVSQIKGIIDYQVAEGTNQHLAKDMWLLSYYCNGMNIKDIINLRFKNIENDTIYYERLKTSSTNQTPKPIIVALIPEAKEIISRWKRKKRGPNSLVFPVLKESMSEHEKTHG
jgi:integrase/recombinase XerD